MFGDIQLIEPRGDLRLPQREYCLLGKNRDTPTSLQSEIIQKSIAVVYPAQLPQASGQI